MCKLISIAHAFSCVGSGVRGAKVWRTDFFSSDGYHPTHMGATVGVFWVKVNFSDNDYLFSLR